MRISPCCEEMFQYQLSLMMTDTRRQSCLTTWPSDISRESCLFPMEVLLLTSRTQASAVQAGRGI